MLHSLMFVRVSNRLEAFSGSQCKLVVFHSKRSTSQMPFMGIYWPSHDEGSLSRSPAFTFLKWNTWRQRRASSPKTALQNITPLESKSHVRESLLSCIWSACALILTAAICLSRKPPLPFPIGRLRVQFTKYNENRIELTAFQQLFVRKIYLQQLPLLSNLNFQRSILDRQSPLLKVVFYANSCFRPNTSDSSIDFKEMKKKKLYWRGHFSFA